MARSNKYATSCWKCGGHVPAEEGLLDGKDPVRNFWRVKHETCPAVPVEPVAVPVGNVAAAPPKQKFDPTPEQVAVIDAFLSGESLVVEAGAGTGKTSTLVLCAEAAPERTMQYLAFNVSVREEVKTKMPKNVKVNNYHQLAWRAICADTPFAGRLRAPKMKSEEVARRLGVESFDVPEQMKSLAPWKVAGIVMATVAEYCKTSDTNITRKHVPYVDGLDVPGKRGKRHFDVNRRLAEYVVPFARAAWRDLSNEWGQLPFTPDNYLKMWQLSHPKIEADVILFDEAQDANPVVAAVVAEQVHAQRVYVGDAQQAIYEFTGAVDAISAMKASGIASRQIRKSFRFGQPIADAANEILSQIPGADLRIEGFDKIDSHVGPFDGEPDAILTRTNAFALTCLLEAQERGVRAYLVGGGKEMAAFALGARDLMRSGHSTHHELSMFNSWAEVKQYVEEDEQGAELKLNVDLVERFGVETILAAINGMPKESDADLTISTAHKSKGLEWDRVLIGSDFVKQTKEGEEPPVPTPAELRLRYVACTRARKALDNSALAPAGAE